MNQAKPLSKTVLFSYFRSSCSWRIRTILNHKKIPYELSFVNLLKNEQRSEEFLKLNPLGKVPALHIDGITIYESVAIAEYLEETRPEVPMLPKDPRSRAIVRQLCEGINSGIQPLQNLSLVRKLQKDHGVDQKEHTLHWVSHGLEGIEEELGKCSGKYCFGDQITLADAFLVPQVKGTKDRFGLDTSKFKHIEKVMKNLEEIEEFKKAFPENQPDFVK